MVKGTD